MPPEAPAPDARKPTPDDVRKALARVLASPGFRNAPAVSGFLSFVVERALSGEAGGANAYGIATEALGRGADFDPVSDPVVRVTAGRLRHALDRYYLEDGADDPVFIALPKGAYEPEFTCRRPPAIEVMPRFDTDEVDVEVEEVEDGRATAVVIHHSRRRQGLLSIGEGRSALYSILVPLVAALFGALALAVVLFATRPEPTRVIATASDGVPDQVSSLDVFPRVSLLMRHADPLPIWYSKAAGEAAARSIIGRFDDVALLSANSSLTSDYRIVLNLVGARDAIQLFARLERSSTGLSIWTDEYTIRHPASNSVEEVVNFFGPVLSPILSPYGVLYSDMAQLKPNESRFACIATAYSYFDYETPAAQTEAQRCLGALIDEGVTHPTLFALKAYLHLEAYRSGRLTAFDSDDPLDDAYRAAKRAVETAPRSPRALQALFDVEKVTGNYAVALELSNRLLEANPYDLDITMDVAAFLVSRGYFAEATPMFEAVRRVSARSPAWFVAYDGMLRWRTESVAAAAETLRQIEPEQTTIGAMMIAIVSHESGDVERRNHAVRTLLSREAGFTDNPEDRIRRRGFALDLSKEIGAALAEAIFAAESG